MARLELGHLRHVGPERFWLLASVAMSAVGMTQPHCVQAVGRARVRRCFPRGDGYAISLARCAASTLRSSSVGRLVSPTFAGLSDGRASDAVGQWLAARVQARCEMAGGQGRSIARNMACDA